MNKCDICDKLFNENSHSPFPEEIHCEECETAIHSSVDDIDIDFDDDPYNDDEPLPFVWDDDWRNDNN